MQMIQNPHLSLNQVTDRYLQPQKAAESASEKRQSEKKVLFQDILHQKCAEETQTGRLGAEGLKFSKHAAGRLADRNITLSDGQMQRLHEAASIASEKGIKESLVVVDSLAFIVNIPNHTVVTAMDNTRADENVYTNIDGAVIM